jgi:hypothetical protein
MRTPLLPTRTVVSWPAVSIRNTVLWLTPRRTETSPRV